MIEIVETGPLATVQDRGRYGYASLGVARSGAFDSGACALANRLVGNSPDAACIEVTLGGLVIRTHDAVTVAIAGAECPGLDWGTPTTIGSATVVRLGSPPRGARTYLAIRGGIAVDMELGSRSTDTIGGLGPAPLRAGDLLPVGSDHLTDVSGVAAAPAPPSRRLRVVLGPRADWFSEPSLAVLTGAAWMVRPASNRVGLRLDGPVLDRVRSGELVSEPTLPGAIQVPPDGRPILFGPDSPVTGGYPVIAVVRRADLDIAAQLRPGDTVGFRM